MKKQNGNAEKNPTATEAFGNAMKSIADATELINAKMAWVRKQAEQTGKINWAHVGTATKVASDLEELLRFIGPTGTCPDCDSRNIKPTTCTDALECQNCGAIF